jgi:hypothetical protein
MKLSAISLALCFGLVPFAAHATADAAIALFTTHSDTRSQRRRRLSFRL